jgi:hypothetical protein
VSWDTSSGITGVFASFFPNFNAIGVGKASAFLAFPNPSVGINNISGTAGLFTGAVNQVPPGDGVTGLPAGTYLVGTIVFDTSNVDTRINPLAGIIQAGLDGFVDLNNQTITDVAFGDGLLVATYIVPEPGTASLLGLGLLGLIVAGRRNRK